MRLKQIKLKNFKGQTRDITLSDIGVSLSGENGAGKTTVLDAVCWCLFGKFSDRTEQSPKPLDSNNQPITCEVGVELWTDRGIFLRTYNEIWKTPRGKANKEFAGHETKYHIDTLQVLARDFNERIAEYFSEEEFFITAIPTYFGTLLHWKDRRDHLYDLTDEPTNEQLLIREPELSDILEEGKDTKYYEDMLKKKKTELKSINEQRSSLPDRIDENRRLIKQVEKTPEQIDAEIKAKTEEKDNILKTGSSGSINTQIDSLTKDISDLRQQKTEALSKLYNEKDKELESLQNPQQDNNFGDLLKNLREARSERDAYSRNSSDIETTINENKSRLSHERERIEGMQEQVEDLTAEMNNIKPDTEICSFCKQKLPEEMIKQDVDKKKGRIVETINGLERQIDTAKDKLDRLQRAIDNLEKEYKETMSLVGEAQEKVDKLEKEYEAKKEEKERSSKEVGKKIWEVTNNYDKKIDDTTKEFEDAIAETQEKINSLRNSIQKPNTTIIDGEIERLQEIKATLTRNIDLERRIEHLEALNKTLASEAETLLRSIYLYELRLRTWARIIEEDINAKFDVARFKLFEIQVNGEVKEVCEVLYNGKTTMSQGEAIHVGIDIAETFAKEWTIDDMPPLMIDGVQNITLDIATDRQKILTQTTKDPELVVEEL